MQQNFLSFARRAVICGIAGVLFSLPAAAASISLSRQINDGAFPGVPFGIEIHMDFTADPTLGGGIDIFFNSAILAFHSYEAAMVGDSDFQRDPDVGDGELTGIAFGDFSGLSGPALVGTIFFVSHDLFGFTPVSAAQNLLPVGPFVSATTFEIQEVAFGSVIVESVRPIPVPAAIWLLLSALAVGIHVSPRQQAAV